MNSVDWSFSQANQALESPQHPLCSNKCANIVNEQNIFPSHYLIPTMPTQYQGLEK